jgi:hypothetical protein
MLTACREDARLRILPLLDDPKRIGQYEGGEQ